MKLHKLLEIHFQVVTGFQQEDKGNNTTYEYYKTNYMKLTKAERHTNKDFQERFLEESHQNGLKMIKENMDERLDSYMNGND